MTEYQYEYIKGFIDCASLHNGGYNTVFNLMRYAGMNNGRGTPKYQQLKTQLIERLGMERKCQEQQTHLDGTNLL
jgi:nitric oxide synthase oxygenase domain/subunit